MWAQAFCYCSTVHIAQHAPYLENLDPSTVRMFCHDLCRVAHDHGIHMPAHEEFRPEETFSRIECSDTRTARVPKFCQSQVQRWEAIMHHHLKRDKVIPSSHPQANEIKHNPNGYEALTLLIYPYHPGCAENGILIKSHPQQGKRSLDGAPLSSLRVLLLQTRMLFGYQSQLGGPHSHDLFSEVMSELGRSSHPLQSRATRACDAVQVHAQTNCCCAEGVHG